MKIINHSICAPQGFLCAGIHAGLKKNPQNKDLCLIYSQTPATAAGVFTTNKAKAAPVILTENKVKQHKIQAIITNSGNANACTGEQGMADAQAMAQYTAAALNLPTESVAVSSTGVIGQPLPIDKITTGIKDISTKLGPHDEEAQQAILTTDTFTKSIAVEFELGGKTVKMGGIAKGSGMIHPMMATMLGYVTTDAAISKSALQQALSEVIDDTFHMISVDGDTSTNDMVLVLANGLAANDEITDISSEDWHTFKQALSFICTELAKQIARDGEGASKMIEINLTGALCKHTARTAAKAICKSSLVKTAVFGEDANWGRILSAIGASGIAMDLNKLSISIGDAILFKDGMPTNIDEAGATEHLKQKNVSINANLGMGTETATAWGCDLTYDYIKINADYRS
jgi:glutamate N-acetyltransferase/amino-acid N-acetyltransferase